MRSENYEDSSINESIANEQDNNEEYTEEIYDRNITENINENMRLSNLDGAIMSESLINPSNENINTNSEENNFDNDNFLENINDESFRNLNQELVNYPNNNEINFDLSDDLSEFENAREVLKNYEQSKNKYRKSNNDQNYQFSNFPIQGTMYQQAYNLLVLNDVVSPTITCYCGNNDINGLSNKTTHNKNNNNNNKYNNNSNKINNTHGIENRNLKKTKTYNNSNEFIVSILKHNLIDTNNNGNKKCYNIFSSTPIASQMELEKKYFKNKARPTLPLTLKPTKNRNRYTYSFFYNTSFDSYFENNPPTTVKANWREGISNLYLNIHKNLK